MRGPNLPARAAATIALWTLIAGVATSAGAVTAPGRWALVTHTASRINIAGEGVASYPNGRLLFRGLGQVPAAVSAFGFNHVGDEDIDSSGDVYDAYENDHPGPPRNCSRSPPRAGE